MPYMIRLEDHEGLHLKKFLERNTNNALSPEERDVVANLITLMKKAEGNHDTWVSDKDLKNETL